MKVRSHRNSWHEADICGVGNPRRKYHHHRHHYRYYYPHFADEDLRQRQVKCLVQGRNTMTSYSSRMFRSWGLWQLEALPWAFVCNFSVWQPLWSFQQKQILFFFIEPKCFCFILGVWCCKHIVKIDLNYPEAILMWLLLTIIKLFQH